MDPDRKAQSQQVKSTLGADTYRVCRLRMRRLTQHQIGPDAASIRATFPDACTPRRSGIPH
jgi:hypothetical protein